MDDLVHNSMHYTCGVGKFNMVAAVYRGLSAQRSADLIELGGRKQKAGIEGIAAGLQEPDFSALVPHIIALTKVLDEHHHVYGIHCTVDAASVDRADIIPRSPGERKPNPDLPEV